MSGRRAHGRHAAGQGSPGAAHCWPPTSTDPDDRRGGQRGPDADAIVVATPVYQAAYSGLLKVFLDLLPQFAFRGKAVLPIVTGGSPAHVLAVDYALRPVLANLGAAHIGQGWFVPVVAHPACSPTAGVLIEPASLAPLAQVTDEFLDHRRSGSTAGAVVPARVDAAGRARVSPIAGQPGSAGRAGGGRRSPADSRCWPTWWSSTAPGTAGRRPTPS